MRCLCVISAVVLLFNAKVFATEEVHSFEFEFHKTKVHGVVDLDADENWLSHHIFPTQLGPGVTIARDHSAGIEIFRHDGEEACYARPIQMSTRSVWEFKSMLEIEEEHHFNMTLPRRKLEEFLECTSKLVPHSRLGKVAYLCRGFPVYWLKETREPISTGAGQDGSEGVEGGETTLDRVKRYTVLAQRGDSCGFCISCCKSTKEATASLSLSRTKRELLAVEACTRIVYIQGCPPQAGPATKQKENFMETPKEQSERDLLKGKKEKEGLL